MCILEEGNVVPEICLSLLYLNQFPYTDENESENVINSGLVLAQFYRIVLSGNRAVFLII